MKKIDVKKIQAIIKNQGIAIDALVLHGSSILKVQNRESDIDILGVVESGSFEDIVEIIDGEKYHIIFKDKEYLKNLSDDFSYTILNRISDFNTLSGRVLSGKILWEKHKGEISLIISENYTTFDKTILDKKLRYQMFGQLKDATTGNKYINLICIQNALDTLICRFLIKKDIFFLNQKWFPVYIDEYFDREISECYYNLRFSLNPDLIEFKKILEWVDTYEI